MTESEADDQLISAISSVWQKVAMVIGKVLSVSPDAEGANLAARIEKLVAAGRVELRGDLGNWRTSELRAPRSEDSAVTRGHLRLVETIANQQSSQATVATSGIKLRQREIASPRSVEEQRRRLKILILLGKERGFLTYAEINDHLPDMVDAEQIEAITTTFNEMGIDVREAESATSNLNGEPF